MTALGAEPGIEATDREKLTSEAEVLRGAKP